ncbi:MAG: hypothetical protein EB830_03315 [Nitrosopumilus sp. H13]|nr:MAG: hypothetical protein EB830_03315 [Nitrosopumilus sp. H13]
MAVSALAMHDARYDAVGAFYAPLSYTDPVFEPRVVEPLVDPPVFPYGCHNTFGYNSAEHNPEDDSITITYFDRTSDQQAGRCIWPFFSPNPSATGLIHTQTYHVNQTFAYACRDFDDHTKVYLYQYKGTSLLQGARSFVFVHFEMKVPERVPCTFPDYLIHTVDVYDARDFDQIYDLDYYVGPPEGADDHYTTYVEPVRYAVPITPLYVDPYPPSWLDEDSTEGWITDITHNTNDSVTITYQDLQEYGHVPGTDHVHTYVSGQTFLVHCMEWKDVTWLNIYSYRGSEMREYGGEHVEVLVFANFKAYTRVPIPCTYPEVLIETTDAFDASRFDRQYDIAKMI